jgi:eukaryotic translation initiation factor 2C
MITLVSQSDNTLTSMSVRYRPGRLLDLCLQFLRKPGRPDIRPEQLAPRSGFPERERLKLQRFISGIRIVTNLQDESGKVNKTPRVVKKVSQAGASDLSFQMREGGSMTVAVRTLVRFHSSCSTRTVRRSTSRKHTINDSSMLTFLASR